MNSSLQPDRLVPIGAVGELVLEGPLVGRGYLNDPDKTASAFICNPAWLQSEDGTHIPRPQSRFYRTGDLVRCDSEDRLAYVGRMDTQVKLRRQRVELEEFEYHVRNLLPVMSYTVAAEVVEITTQDPNLTSQKLVVFLSPTETQNGLEDLPSQKTVPLPLAMANDLTRELTQILPLYMVPASFSMLRQIPLSPAGKVDRKSLRRIGTCFHLDARQQNGPVIEPEKKCEVTLRELWPDVLGIISRLNSFFELGGRLHHCHWAGRGC